MGITQKSIDRITPFLKPKKKMLELGAQNMYDNLHYGMIAKHYFESIGIVHRSLDIIEYQGAEKLDLRDDLKFDPVYDIVTDMGTCEHIDGSLYQPYKNIHEACAFEGIMIHENPARGNWPFHGQHYFSEKFYVELAKACNYELLEVNTEAAMSNTIDGWNIAAVLRKTTELDFISEEAFNKIYKKHIKSK